MFQSTAGKCFFASEYHRREWENYFKKDVKKAYKARNFWQTTGNASTKTLLQMVDNHELKNCPITREYVKVIEDILGPNIQSLQGKTPRKTPSAVNTPKVSSLPTFVKSKYIMITLCADIMFANGVQFLWPSPNTSVSGHLSISPMQRHTMLCSPSSKSSACIRGEDSK